jgi:hypothetical protein
MTCGHSSHPPKGAMRHSGRRRSTGGATLWSKDSTVVTEQLIGKRTAQRKRDSRASGGGVPDPPAWGKWRWPVKSFKMAADDVRDGDETMTAVDWWCSSVRWGSYSSGDLHERGTVTDGSAQLEKKRHATLIGDTDSEATSGPTDNSASNDKITIIPFLKIIKRTYICI